MFSSINFLFHFLYPLKKIVQRNYNKVCTAKLASTSYVVLKGSTLQSKISRVLSHYLFL